MGEPRHENLELMRCSVVDCSRPARGYGILRVQPAGPVDAQPGQFAMLEVPRAGTLLHRPMSIMDAGDTLEFLIREVGQGTRSLVSLQAGDEIRMIAPLGQGFAPAMQGQREVLVGGGVGASPLIFHAARNPRPRMIYGGRTGADLVMRERASRVADLVEVTEDGSCGVEGMATGPLSDVLDAGGVDRVLTCGPVPMMAAVARLCADHRVSCLACMEALMACGFGACLGCAVPSRQGGYLYVCSDGPVLDAMSVLFEPLLAAAR